MFDALYISATGMQAQQLNVDTIANNLANVNTTGFKRSKVGFSDLMVREAARQSAFKTEGSGVLDAGERLGAGVGVSGISKIFEVGDLKKTESAFDIAIQGEGFLEVTMPDGSSAYTRGGSFQVNREGLLATAAGFPLKPSLAIPDNAENMVVETNGKVWVQVAGEDKPFELGQLELVRFTNSSGLLAQGDGLYRSGATSGEAITARPAEDGAGTLAQGFLEGSNVKLTEEMVSLMVAQRVYEANVKVMQASDEMLGMINGLRR